MLLRSLRSGNSQLTLASAFAPLLHPHAKGSGSRAPPKGGLPILTQKICCFRNDLNNIHKKVTKKRKAFEGVGDCHPIPPWLLFSCVEQFEMVSQMAFHARKKVRSIEAPSTTRKSYKNKLRLGKSSEPQPFSIEPFNNSFC